MVRIGNVMLSRTAITGLVALVAACGSVGSSYSGQGGPAPSATLMVATDARLGGHLVDGNGRSLYYFAKDLPADGNHPAASNCDSSCLPIWPIFDPGSVVTQGIDPSDVGQITRTDGRMQATYKGFPLYYYVGDAAAGDTHGDGVNGIWYVVHDPNYSITMLSKVSEAASYLTDSAGRALYFFAQDTVGSTTTSPVSACTSAQCIASWPVFLTDGVTVPSALDVADFAAFTRTDGARQSAYKGHPLYYYVGDTAPGDTNGRSVPDWQTLDPAAL
jgi:predicted lipoprotein with Yx(FWY)xxD motif